MRRLRYLAIGMVALGVVAAPVAASPNSGAESALGQVAPSAAPSFTYPPLADLEIPNPARERVLPSEWLKRATSTDRSLAGFVRSTDAPVPAWTDPDTSGEPAWQIPAINEFGSPLVLAVVDATDDMVKVQVPLRPNSSEAWVRVADFNLRFVSSTIVVDLSDRTLSYFEFGEHVFTETVTVGRPAHPTPTGTYYLRDSFAWDANSVYGAYVMPLSAYSESIETINGGDAVVAIHGTKRPEELGQAKSLGCIRMPNDRISEMAASIDLGTWVHIQP